MHKKGKKASGNEKFKPFMGKSPAKQIKPKPSKKK
jgi:hypothetical protein